MNLAVRIISSFLSLPLFFIIIYFLPDFCYPTAVSALCTMMVYELLWRNRVLKNFIVMVPAYISALVIPFLIYFEIPRDVFITGLFVLVLALFTIWIFNKDSLSLKALTIVIFGAVIIPLFFSLTISILMRENGKFLILIPFIAAWLTDTGAYFTGVLFGRHKLAPVISPKKTWEGALGGILFCMLSFMLYGYILNAFFAKQPDFSGFLLFAAVLSVIAQIGDLSFSLIKREYSIKDFGTIFPGHGGILDRFDSVIFTSPAVFILLRYFENIIR